MAYGKWEMANGKLNHSLGLSLFFVLANRKIIEAAQWPCNDIKQTE